MNSPLTLLAMLGCMVGLAILAAADAMALMSIVSFAMGMLAQQLILDEEIERLRKGIKRLRKEGQP